MDRNSLAWSMVKLLGASSLASQEVIAAAGDSFTYRGATGNESNALATAAFLDRNDWIVLPTTERDQLTSDPLAKALYAFYSSHRFAFAMLPETLKKLMGRESMQNSKWLRVLASALERVKAATRWPECEIAKDGKYKGKVVVTKRLRRRPKTKSAAS